VPKPRAAPAPFDLIQYVRDGFKAGRGAFGIALDLDRLGVPAPEGQSGWNRRAVRAILFRAPAPRAREAA